MRIATRLSCALGVTVVLVGAVSAMDYDRAAGMMPAGPPYMKGGHQEIGHTVEGEVVRIEGDDYFVEDPYGNEVRMVVNQSTLRTGPIKQGERIEARVNNEDYALSIRPVREPDSTGFESGERTER